MKKILIIIVSLLVLVGCEPEDKPDIEPAKPVIYLYPEQEMDVEVYLEYNGEFTYTYPEYKDGWQVTAYPDGKLIDKNSGRTYSYLFWEGQSDYVMGYEDGFVVSGDAVEDFLVEKLSFLGLESHEYNEFIVYWVPLMKDNKYNLIRFVEEEYQDLAKLTIKPEPDSMLRVFMIYKALDEPIEIKEQVLKEFNRDGFSVIEWGGAEIK